MQQRRRRRSHPGVGRPQPTRASRCRHADPLPSRFHSLGGCDHCDCLIPWMVASCPPCLSASDPLFLSSRSSSPSPTLTKRFYYFQAVLKWNRFRKGAADPRYAPGMSTTAADQGASRSGIRGFDECFFYTSGSKCLITRLVLVSFVTYATGDWVCGLLTGEESAPMPHCRRRRFPAEGRGLSPAAAVCQGCSSSGGHQNPSHYSLSIQPHPSIAPLPSGPKCSVGAYLNIVLSGMDKFKADNHKKVPRFI
jgi:hypothetical protein